MLKKNYFSKNPYVCASKAPKSRQAKVVRLNPSSKQVDTSTPNLT